ncbi:MAG TPA: alkaline phosphatase family protein [Trebonia sp.]|jgi:phospholipase C|nr:alkaline phosphatase family protein [Trebonia sp.]
MRYKRFLVAGAVPLLAVAAAVTSATAATTTHAAPKVARTSSVSTTSASSAGITNSPIKHVIEIMIENHTFDNLFGSFPGADGIPQNASFLNPNAYFDSAPNVSPVYATPNEGDIQGSINNSRVVEQMAMDYVPGKGYQMDHYTTFPQDGMSAITEFGPSFDPNEQYLAQNFELADHNFQPVIAPTQPNVMTALNGTAHDWYYNNLEPGSTQPWNSIFDELSAHDRNWKIYYALPPSVLDGTIWDQIIPSDDSADLTTGDQFFTDLADGNLPDFSFVRPGVGYSTEPPEDIGEGDAWIGQLVNAVAHSQYWDSTAIFVTYDEGGGFWDNVAPSYASGYGTRTPMIIISPYARKGVFHQQTTNVSILKFMQTLWGLPPLTSLNAKQNNLLSAFDFRQAPLAPPAPPVAPADTIGFHGSGGILTDIGVPGVNSSLTINLEAETGGLSLDDTVNGPVNLTLTPPSGVSVPSSFPATETLVNGQATFSVKFPAAGYYRIEAKGPNGTVGWVTVDVGVTPNTAP